MSDLTTSGWFPVITLILGFITKSMSDWFGHFLSRSRERESRNDDKQEKRTERRIDFQRQTLLDLQETAMFLARNTGEAQHIDLMVYKKTGAWQKELLPDDLDENFRSNIAKVNMLRVRVLDSNIRTLADNFRKTCTATILAHDKNSSDSRSALKNASASPDRRSGAARWR